MHEHLHTIPVDLLSAAATHDAALVAAEKWRPIILVHNAGWPGQVVLIPAALDVDLSEVT